MSGNMVIIHGGGPTAVINASLYGAVEEAKKHPEVGRIYAAIGGTGGLLHKKLLDLREIPQEELDLLLTSPASAIGTSRDHLEPEDYAAMVPVFEEFGIRYVLLNGGNGTMDTCSRIYEQCCAHGISVMGIPKTMDNDIAVTDHSPGFGSAARYMAVSTAEVCADVRGLPIHIVVIEALGRNAGWVTASSALAADCGVGGPDLIYLPERAFDEAAFLRDVQELIDRKGCGVVVASEGLHDADGKPIVEPVFQVGRAVYFGDVSSHLANLITKKLGYKARSEKPGLLGRASIALQSACDREEAVLAGKLAAEAVVRGESGKMVGFRRLEGEPYRIEPMMIEIEQVMLHEKGMPDSFINEAGNGVTQAFLDWCRPLLGGPLPRLISFAGREEVRS